MRAAIVIVMGVAIAAGPGRGADDLAAELPRTRPLAPAEALASIRARPGVRVDLVAAEPLVADPVAACYDADGRLYVVEMRGYPYPEDSPSGGVRRLEDGDGDGRFDKSTMFLDGLSWPTGIAPYDGGVFVAAAPDVLYAKDIDGDGRADGRRVAFTGFGTQNVQALVNGLAWGPDGWIYGVSGGNGGDIRAPDRPDADPVSVRGRDFRFRPDGSAFEAISGGGQFGHAFDDWGRRFTCNNSDHIRQILLPSHYLERNPALAAPGVVASIAAEGPAAPVYRISPPEPWRVVRTRQRVADPVLAAGLAPTERAAFGFFTSATGVTIYRGSAFPAEFRGNAFIGDVGGNLVHRKILTAAGAASIARRAEPDVPAEFLASTDNWFRPVNFANTPSGTLLVLDMYRETIEHPASIPEPIKAHLDLTGGRDRGRIYEVVPEGFDRHRRPRMSVMTTAELVPLLADPDAWWRETAQRLLIERRDLAAVPPLRAMAADRPNALGRVHALWTLDALGALEADDCLAAFADPEPGVREQATRLSESRLGASDALRRGLIARANDPDARARFQAAFSLGELRDPSAVPALVAIAARDRDDPWARAAVLSSLRGRLAEFFAALIDVPGFARSPGGASWIAELAATAGASGDPAESRSILEWLATPAADPTARRAAALGLDRGLRRAGGSLRTSADAATIAPMFESARRDAADETLAAPRRAEAIRLVGLGPVVDLLASAGPLLDARQPAEVQLAAIAALSGVDDPRAGPLVASRWRSLGPSARLEAAEYLFARPERVAALLDAIEAGAIAANDLDPARRRRWLQQASPALRERGERLLAVAPTAGRARAIEAARGALAMAGDRGRGLIVFDKACASCHRAEGRGEAVGPDLATVAGRTPEDLITHILDPNREVAPQYLDYQVATIDGRVVTGLIAAESADALTLRRAGGVAEVVPREQIDAIATGGLSIMPEGLESGLSPADLADLIAYLRGLAAPR